MRPRGREFDGETAHRAESDLADAIRARNTRGERYRASVCVELALVGVDPGRDGVLDAAIEGAVVGRADLAGGDVEKQLAAAVDVGGGGAVGEPLDDRGAGLVLDRGAVGR